MKPLLLSFVLILLAGGLSPVRADTPVLTGASSADFKPNVAKFLAAAPREVKGYLPGFPLIVQKNMASMHQIQSLSVDFVIYAPGKTPGTDPPESTCHIDWQKPDKGRLQQFRDGKQVSEQVADGTYRWQWYRGNSPVGGPVFATQYMKMDMQPRNFPQGAAQPFASIGGLNDPNGGPLFQPFYFLGSQNLKDLGETSSPGTPPVHRISLRSGQRGTLNPTTHGIEFVDINTVYDLNPLSGLPLLATNTDPTLSGPTTFVYQNYRINPPLPAETFVAPNPDQYTYYPSPALPLRPGQTAPDFALTDRDGQPVTLSGLLGKPVLLCFVQPPFFGSNPADLADTLEQLSHYIDVKSVTVVLITNFPPMSKRPRAGQNVNVNPQFTNWITKHPYLTKVWFVDNGKGFGDKIQATVMNEYGVSNIGAVLIDKDGKIAANFTMTYNTGQPRLQSLGKTEADDTYLKGPSALDSVLAADIAALGAK